MKFSHYLALIALVGFASETNCITLYKDPKKDDDEEEHKDKKKDDKDDEEEAKEVHTKPIKTEDYASDKLPNKN